MDFEEFVIYGGTVVVVDSIKLSPKPEVMSILVEFGKIYSSQFANSY